MRTIILVVGLTILIPLSFLRLTDPAAVVDLREAYFDQLQRLAPRVYEPLPVRVIDVDEAALGAIGQWPWPRHIMAELVERLDSLGAAAIAFDVVFAEPDRLSPAAMARDPRLAPLVASLTGGGIELPDNDRTFAAAIAGRPVILGVAEVRQDTQAAAVATKAAFVEIGDNPALGFPALGGTTAIVPVLAEAAAGMGSVNVSRSDTATIVRRVPLAWRAGDTILPSLALESLRVALGETTVLVAGSQRLAGAVDFVSVGGIEIPTSETGEVRLRYRLDDPRLYVSAAALLEGENAEAVRPLIEGHIVLIGTSAAGLLDVRASALGENIPGVSIHAQIIEQALLGDFLIRSDWTEGLELALFVTLGLAVVAAMAFGGPVLASAASGAAAAAVGLGSWFAFQAYGLLLDASFPLVGGTLVLLAVTGFRFLVADREKRIVRRAFSHYVAPSVLQEIERSGHKLALGGEIREVTVLFGDIRGFTPLAAKLGPVRLVTLLNGLFDALSRAILVEEGTIDKFIGDAVMAFWNAPLQRADHPARACRAALGMRRALVDFNSDRDNTDGGAIALAIGISTGEACVGNMGSRDRFNYSAIGDTVNRAARIEAACRRVGYDIVVCAGTARAAEGLALLDAGLLDLKGISDRLTTVIVAGDAALARSDEFRALAERHARLREAAEQGEDAFAAALAACRSLAPAVEPGLSAFYHALERRREDFCEAPERRLAHVGDVLEHSA